MSELLAPDVLAAVQFQQGAFTLPSLASPLYHHLLGVVLEDHERGGPAAAALARAPEGLHAWDDAVVLRFLGGVHRLVLTGAAPDLAEWFPTAGGERGLDGPGEADAAAAAFRATCEAHHEELVASLDVPVQTNEVARCAALVVGFTEVLRATGLPLRLLELGSSAGLNLRAWDRWHYRSGSTAWGDPGAELRFEACYHRPHPDLAAPLGPSEAVVERRGCDRNPLDPVTDEGRLLLRSFVWPDQAQRHARLDAALRVAADVPATVDRADAGAWVAEQLADPRPGTATVVFHSIVWQYLPEATKAAVASAVAAAGAAATAEAPVAWLRMEPGPELSEAAELRLTTWPAAAGRAAVGGDGAGGDERVVARTGFHGDPVWAGDGPHPA